MKLFEEITTNNPDWSIIENEIPNARSFVKQYKNSRDCTKIFEVKLTLICLMIYYTAINTDNLYNVIQIDNCITDLKTLDSVLTAKQAIQLNLAWNKYASTHSLIGQKYVNEQNYAQAAAHFARAFKVYESINQQLNAGLSLYNQATSILIEPESSPYPIKYEIALPIFKKAADLLQDKTTTQWQARSEYYVGFCLVALKKYQEAIKHFENALPLYDEDRLRQRQAGKLNQTADKLMRNNQHNLAQYYRELARRTVEYKIPTITTSLPMDSDAMDVDVTGTSFSQPAEMPSHNRFRLTLSA